MRCFKIIGITAGTESSAEIIELRDIFIELPSRDQKGTVFATQAS